MPQNTNGLITYNPGSGQANPLQYMPEEALQQLYAMTGVPDLQAAQAAYQRGEYLPALGQGAWGAAQLGGLLMPALRGLGFGAKLAAPVLQDTSGALKISPIRAYHGTLSPEDIGNNFHPGTHFGTAEAANARIRNLLGETPPEVLEMENPAPAVFPVDIHSNKQLTIPDPDNFGQDLASYLLKNGLITKNELDKSGSAINALRKKGYDLLNYINDMEDPGSTSYITLDPSIVKNALTTK